MEKREKKLHTAKEKKGESSGRTGNRGRENISIAPVWWMMYIK